MQVEEKKWNNAVMLGEILSRNAVVEALAGLDSRIVHCYYSGEFGRMQEGCRMQMAKMSDCSRNQSRRSQRTQDFWNMAVHTLLVGFRN